MPAFLLEIVIRAPVVLFALTIHEFMHGYVAYRCGDPTAHNMGRLTLNPLPHLDPIGTLCLFLGPIGWAKPVPVNPFNFRHPRRDYILVSIAGPGSNFILGAALCLAARVLAAMEYFPVARSPAHILCQLLALGAILNFGLGVFNLIPIAPLDGHHVVRELLPARLSERYMHFMRVGPYILLGLVFFGGRLFSVILMTPINLLTRLFAGEAGSQWLSAIRYSMWN
ncbi:MAG: site-2 protease family protein [Planctomycetia bacterium]|nr:site-2 protease family protein [Planctomycetia bacterium]